MTKKTQPVSLGTPQSGEIAEPVNQGFVRNLDVITPERDYTKDDKVVDMKKVTRSTIVMGLCFLLLTAVVRFTQGLGLYAGIAVGCQAFAVIMHSLPNRMSDKYYDGAGTLTHYALFAASFMQNFKDSDGVWTGTATVSLRQVLMTFLATTWSVRLGTFLFSRIIKDGTDRRMQQFRNNHITWSNVWMVQAIWVFITDLPVVAVNTLPAHQQYQFGTVTDILGIAVWFVGFWFQVLGDAQKSAFRSRPGNEQRFITSGVWGLTQHPNHFGEATMWFAMSLMCYSNATVQSGPIMYIQWLSPVLTYIIVMHTGVGMLDKKAEKKWGKNPVYMDYRKKVPLFFPDSILVMYGYQRPIDVAHTEEEKKEM